MSKSYDIIIAGAGLAGLSLVVRLGNTREFANKSILLIDRDEKKKNDRTWCFWATASEIEHLPPVIHHSWPSMDFFSPAHSKRLHVGGYRYCMVRGADFYSWAKSQIAARPNIEWIKADIQTIDAQSGKIQTNQGDFEGQLIFNSAFTPYSMLPQKQDLYQTPPLSHFGQTPSSNSIHLLQHFKGWTIESKEAKFDPSVVTLMDFRIEQHGYTRFVYVLPFSPHRALVEFTVFSPTLLTAAEYETELKGYIRQFLDIQDFTIEEEEFGVIPMTDYRFAQTQEGRMIHIGTSGGFVKGSSGYAFKRTNRKMDLFVQAWASTGRPDPACFRSPRQYRVYDSIFLRALNDNLISSQVVFSSFFKNLNGVDVFRFLDEEAGLQGDFRALSAVPFAPFVKALFRQNTRLTSV